MEFPKMHRRTWLVVLVAAVVALTARPASLTSLCARQAEAFTLPPVPTPIPSRLVYAAKFLCGPFALEGPVKPGSYQTAINVHNPHSKAIGFIKKAVLLFDASNPPREPEQPSPPGERIEAKLEPDWGLEIDCLDIRHVLLKRDPSLGASFIKGFVVIETAGFELDVVAVYTAHTFTSGGATAPGTGGGTDASSDTTTGQTVTEPGVVQQPEGFSLDVERIQATRAF